MVALLTAIATSCTIATGRVRTSDGRVREQRIDGGANASLVRAEAEIPCPRAEMTVETLGPGGYRVTGCGASLTYMCVFRGFHTACVLNERGSGVAASTGAGSAPAATYTDREVEQLRQSTHRRLAECIPDGARVLRIQLRIEADGTVRRTGAPIYGPEAAECIDRVFASGRMGRTARASRRAMFTIEPVAALPHTDSPPTPSTEDSPDTSPSAADSERVVRALLDARASAILACVSETVLAVDVRWGADGQLDAALPGASSGSAEEGCVRAVVQRLRLEDASASGHVLHVIERDSP